MPTYDYRCEGDGRVYEVHHPMAVSIANWGELCEVGEFDRGNLDAKTPVTKLLRTGSVVRSSALNNPDAPPCMTGGGCSGGHCGM